MDDEAAAPVTFVAILTVFFLSAPIPAGAQSASGLFSSTRHGGSDAGVKIGEKASEKDVTLAVRS